MDGQVRVTRLWDPDGPDGQPALLVAAGEFGIAGDQRAGNIAAWDGRGWVPLGSGTPAGVNGAIYALATLPNGHLVAAGSFITAGGVAASRIARWDGTSWSPLGSGLGNTFSSGVRALAVLPDGSLVAAGRFNTAGGQAAVNVARWDGSAWSPLETGIGNTSSLVTSLAIDGQGHLIAAGSFSTAGNRTARSVARWNGSQWQPIGDGINGTVNALAVLPNGDLVAAGGTAAGGGSGSHVLRWNGTVWSAMTTGLGSLNPNFQAFHLTPEGTLLAAGAVAARWLGATWEILGDGLAGAQLAIGQLPDRSVVIGGSFLGNAQRSASYVARLVDAQWQPFSSGFGGVTGLQLLAMLSLPGSDVVVAGKFRAAGEVEALNIARWNQGIWTPLGSGLDGEVAALARLPDGRVVAGGSFRHAGEVAARGLAAWDGAGWQALTTEPPSHFPIISALTVLANGHLVACGAFGSLSGVTARNLARWDGSRWHPMASNLLGTIAAACTLANGDLIIAGEISNVDGVAVSRIARWNGAVWSPLGTGLNGGVLALHPLPDGRLLVGGRFGTAGGVLAPRVAIWNGSQWSGLGGSFGPTASAVQALTQLANGDIIVGGDFDQAGPARSPNLVRWNGSAWSGFGDGAGGAFDSSVRSLLARPDGGFFVGGGFTTLDGAVRGHFARWGCPVPSADIRLVPLEVTGDGFGLRVEAAPGRPYFLRYSPDLRSWQTIHGPVQGTLEFRETDPVRRAQGAGYYEVAEP